ncbi:hypothetical protein [Streptomyces sp. NPDC023327]|uniref:hypothetical protein n=1 Tax=Streptomyces sp. NPDC023327 TaxID=3157088 RepID=UPI0033FE0997
MPADEARHEGFAEEPRARGPRHAAPRKPLLTRLQVPAGKAIAIAAMPTAVLMGMGLTPTLAQARPGVPENPFQDGPCVTAPDKEADADDKDGQDAEDTEDKAKDDSATDDPAKDDADKDGKGSGEPPAPGSPTTGDEGSGDQGSGDRTPGDRGADDRTEPVPTPSTGGEKDEADKPAPKPAPESGPRSEPEPGKTRNPWDPLGLGDALKDVFTPDGSDESDGPAVKEPDSDASVPDAPAPTPTPDKTTSPEDPAKGTDKDPVKDAADKVEDGVEDGTKDGTKKAEGTTGEAADETADDPADDEAKDEPEDPMAPDANGKKPFPCVVEKKVDGEAEQTPVPIPNQPWHLEATSLKLMDADYQGVVNLTMANGRTKQALKYVVQKTDIVDLHQIVEGPGGRTYHVEAAKGSKSTIRNGATTMYTERISGKLFGLIPITFDPEHPPPLNIPLIYFTDVKVQQAGQFGGDLTIPGLHQSITD